MIIVGGVSGTFSLNFAVAEFINSVVLRLWGMKNAV
jgi:hypothetical protein